MSAAHESPDEMARLLSALEDGTLSSAEEARLAELLKADPQARARYYDHAMLSALLRREGRRAAAQSHEPAVTPRVVTVSTGRRRWWGIALAATILLMLALSVGEATGVTQVVPTIVRIVTGEGALVIEVDDPTVSVTLDGEDVTIKGAGIHELRLRPGTHKVVTTKDGQPVREEVVTIEHGGRQVVKVTRESPADQSSRDLASSEKPKQATQAEELARLNLILQQNPADLNALIQRGALFRRLNREDEALVDFSKVIELAPNRPAWSMAYASRAEIRQNRGDWAGAIADYEQWSKNRPNNFWADGRLGWIYLFAPPPYRDSQKAVQVLERVWQSSPKDHGYSTSLGIAYYRVGRLEEARAKLETASTLPPGPTSYSQYALALCYHAQSDHEKSAACHQQAIALWERTIRGYSSASNLAPLREEVEKTLAPSP